MIRHEVGKKEDTPAVKCSVFWWTGRSIHNDRNTTIGQHEFMVNESHRSQPKKEKREKCKSIIHSKHIAMFLLEILAVNSMKKANISMKITVKLLVILAM